VLFWHTFFKLSKPTREIYATTLKAKQWVFKGEYFQVDPSQKSSS
jgi:hypothetical protein